MNSLDRKTQNLLETAARRLRPHLNKLSSNWRQSYRQIFPEDSETVIRRLDQLNIGTLADCLEKRNIKACFESINYHGRRLAKLGVPQEKIAASLKLYLHTARQLLRTIYPRIEDTDKIVGALEQLQLVEMIIANQSYAHLDTEDFNALISVLDAQLTTEQLDHFLEQLLNHSIKYMQANSGQVTLVQEDDIDQVVMLIDSESHLKKRIKLSPVALTALKKGEPVFSHSRSMGHSAKVTNINSKRRAHSVWAFPIQLKSRRMGVLVLRFNKHYECLPKEREVMEALLSRAALGIERAMLLERIRADEQRIRELTEHILITQDEERRRISRELHDETSHSLLVLKLYIEMIYKELPRKMAPTRKKTREAMTLVEKTLKELRRLISDLGPAMLDDYGLVGAVRWYIKTMHDIFKMKVTLKVSRNFPRLPRNLEVAIYRLVQEGLNNAARHSQATNVIVQLQFETEAVVISISDNGIGFEPERLNELKRKRSFGLFGMQERITLLGGTFTIESIPSKGTVLRVTLPVVVC